MAKELYLKNCLDVVVVDDHVFDFLNSNTDLKDKKFIEYLRKHSFGYPFYQRSLKNPETNQFEVKTIYLHKFIAETFIPKPEDLKDPMVLFKNNNRLDCRLENLFWANRSTLQRIHQKAYGAIKYKGVFKEGDLFKAQAYINKQHVVIGRFKTPEEAAKAYNETILKHTPSGVPVFLNQIPEQ